MKKSILRCLSGVLVIALVIGFFALRTREERVEGADAANAQYTTPASSGAYKDMKYTFLRSFAYGSSKTSQEVTATFETVADMKLCQDGRMAEGNMVKTLGYYENGDGGAAVYKLTKSSSAAGAIELSCGLYAEIQVDTKVIGDKTWGIVSVRQLGATGDGETPDQQAIGSAAMVASAAANQDGIDRAIVYLPAGEYRCTDKIGLGVTNVNMVGEGDDSVIFTDNGYRENSGYSEFFIEVWGGNNSYFADFRVEAREVDLYHYMRQFVVLYSKDIYVKNVSLIVPQEAYSAYYYEDKQYSNFCCYTGNQNITVDGCYMEQMSGTYRGANIGVLDIWSAKENNILIMNCELHGNARDEQIGVFSTSNSNAGATNVEFLNNTVYFYQPKYVDVVGNATMRITVAYSDSNDVRNIRFAGNHFIAECDSKFMTFGAVKNCVVEDNIIEIYCTYKTWSMVFDSSNSDADNIHIQNNEFFITTDCNTGKGNITGGKLKLENNRIFADTNLAFGVLGEYINNNEIITLDYLCKVADAPREFNNNMVYAYNGFGSDGFSNGAFLTVTGAQADQRVQVKGNTIYNYKRSDPKRNTFQSAIMLGSDFDTLEFCDNKYLAPNTRYLDSFLSSDHVNEDGYIDGQLFRYRAGTCKNFILTGNTLQGLAITENTKAESFINENNTYLEAAEVDYDDPLVSRVDILHQGEVVTRMSTTASTVDLSADFYVQDGDGNESKKSGQDFVWYSSVNGLATVSDKGRVTRQKYGEVHIYAVPLDGSGKCGEVVIQFEEAQASDIQINKESLELQPGYRMYADYDVLPAGKASQDLIWESSNPEVATVTQAGLIEAQSLGSAVITCRTYDGSNLKKEIQVNVTEITVKRISLSKSWEELTYAQVGSTYQLLVASYYPTTAVNQSIGRWESSNTEIAVVDNNGLVTIKKNGFVTIRAYATDEQCYGACTFYIQPPHVTGLQAAATKNSVRLTWDSVDNVYGYYVYYKKSTDSEYQAANGGNYVTYCNMDITGLESGVSYDFDVRGFLSNWQSGTRRLLLGEQSVVTCSTYSFIPITTLKSTSNPVDEMYVGDTKEITVTCGPTNADVIQEDKENGGDGHNALMCEMEDESIATVEYVGATNNSFTYKITARSAGITNLIIRSTDARGQELKLPVSVFPKSCILWKDTDFQVSVSYQKATITFQALPEEAEQYITGYMVRRGVGYRYSDVAYLEKVADLKEYTYEDTGNLTEGREYRYIVVPVYKQDNIYLKGSSWDTNSIYVTMPYAVNITSIATDQPVYNVPMGTSGTMTATYEPANASMGDLVFTSFDTRIAALAGQEATSRTIYGTKMGVATVEVASTDKDNMKTYAKVVVTPGAIQGVIAVPGQDSAMIKWDPVDGVDGYFVYKYDVTTGNWDQVADVTTTEYEATGLTSDQIYPYKVAGYLNVDGGKYPGTASVPVNVQTIDGTDLSVSGYAGVYDGAEHAALTWNEAAPADAVWEYSRDLSNWSSEIPMVKNYSDSGTVYIRKTSADDTKQLYYVIAKVEKNPNTPDLPSTTMNVEHRIGTVGEVTLNGAWSWANEGQSGLTIPQGGSVTAVACYVGSDQGNYVVESVEITLNRPACNSADYVKVNQYDPTCEMDGNTGDVLCGICGAVKERGTAIPALGHNWDEGVVIKEATYDTEGQRLHSCTNANCTGQYVETIPATGKVPEQAPGDSGSEAVDTPDPVTPNSGSQEEEPSGGKHEESTDGTQENPSAGSDQSIDGSQKSSGGNDVSSPGNSGSSSSGAGTGTNKKPVVKKKAAAKKEEQETVPEDLPEEIPEETETEEDTEQEPLDLTIPEPENTVDAAELQAEIVDYQISVWAKIILAVFGAVGGGAVIFAIIGSRRRR